MYIEKKNNKARKVGDWVTTEQRHESCRGIFTPGSYVKVIGITERGYDIEDEYGNRMCEVGWII